MNSSVFRYWALVSLHQHEKLLHKSGKENASKECPLKVAYFDPWIISARSLVIFPDSTAPIQAASSFSVKSKSLASLSNFALLLYDQLGNPKIWLIGKHVYINYGEDSLTSKQILVPTCVQVPGTMQRSRLCCWCWFHHLSGEPCNGA